MSIALATEADYFQQARDSARRMEIVGSCRVIKSHAAFLMEAARAIREMPDRSLDPCMGALDETAEFLELALTTVEKARCELKAKEE